MGNFVIAWDYDGVLNNNIHDGRFTWSDAFEKDLGHDLAAFQRQIFGENLGAIFTGQLDLAEAVQDWADAVGYTPGALALLEYWFDRDQMLDAKVLGLVAWIKAQGFAQCIATNNETRRASFMMADPAVSAHFDTIFASGRLGVMKPDAAFFDAVARGMDADPERLILIDDHPDNVASARACGWSAFQFTDATRAELPVFLSDHLGREVPPWNL